MVQADDSNIHFTLAADFINHTSRHIFLTGKAGTGKTTFLKYIRGQTRKHSVVVAPTGVAAINAGGVTMHSFFQLPFGPFIPDNRLGPTNDNNPVADKNTLFKNIRFDSDKRALLQELELLIIDEVSMVRADMLDAMDAILRHFRGNPQQSFGGVQVLFIGDMYQLPPVVNDQEWDLLKTYYDNPFFFSARALEQAPPLYIELKKIYRQNEQSFIDVLNRVRNNQLTPADLALLNDRYRPNFIPSKGEKYITLSTHNRKAEAINAAELEKLPAKTVVFNAALTGDFSDKAFPTEMHLRLKEGAQVMFIKNDTGSDRRFFNGKLATIKKIEGDDIIVTGNDNGDEIKVEKETWRNIRYNLNKETHRIEEEEMGSFTQYPLRLAWAITIHKSQGLTFERAIIDAGASFAAGQVYVALSRCTSLQGLILHSKLYPTAIATDERIIAFSAKEAAEDTLPGLLQQEQQQYLATVLVKTFDWNKMQEAVTNFRDLIPGKKLPDIGAAFALASAMLVKVQEQASVAAKFRQQLQELLTRMQENGDTSVLVERTSKAIDWFIKSVLEDLLQPLQLHIVTLRYASKVKKYTGEVEDIAASMLHHLKRLTQASYGNLLFCKDPSILEKYSKKPLAAAKNASKTKPVKGDSQLDSLRLFKEGNTIAAIAATRQLAESTVTSHLSSFIKTGELAVADLLSNDRVSQILPVVKEIGGDSVAPVKEILGDAFSFTEIRIVMNHWYWLQQQTVNA